MAWGWRWAWLGIAMLAGCAPESRRERTADRLAQIALVGPDAPFLRLLQARSRPEFDTLMVEAATVYDATADSGLLAAFLAAGATDLNRRHQPYLATAPEPLLRAQLDATITTFEALSASPALCERFASGDALSAAEMAPFDDRFRAVALAGLAAALAGREQPVPRAPATAAEWGAVLPPRPAPGAPLCPATLGALRALTAAPGEAGVRVIASYLSGAAPG